MSANNNNTTAADRVEKKSIDEAIASFAMLVRCVLRFALLLFFFLVFQLENSTRQILETSHLGTQGVIRKILLQKVSFQLDAFFHVIHSYVNS